MVQGYPQVPASTRTEFLPLAHNRHTSRCKMAASQSTCNTGAKCTIISCTEQKLLWAWSGHSKSSFRLPKGTDHVFVKRRKEYLSNRDDCRIARLKNITCHSQKVSKVGVPGLSVTLVCQWSSPDSDGNQTLLQLLCLQRHGWGSLRHAWHSLDWSALVLRLQPIHYYVDLLWAIYRPTI